MEVSIQAVSPELGVQFSSTGVVPPAQAGGAAAASSAYEWSMADILRNRAKRTPNARATSPARVGFLNVMGLTPVARRLSAGSERCGVGLAGADAHGGVEREDEDFSVPDLTGLGGCDDRVDGFVDLIRCDRHLDLNFRQEAHRVLRAAVNFRVALLTPVTLDLGHGHPVHADPGESVADLVQFERLDDGHNDFHGLDPRLAPVLQVQLWAICPLTREASFRSQRHRCESSRVPVRRMGRKCVQTKGVRTIRKSWFDPSGACRTNAAQVCTNFNQLSRLLTEGLGGQDGFSR